MFMNHIFFPENDGKHFLFIIFCSIREIRLLNALFVLALPFITFWPATIDQLIYVHDGFNTSRHTLHTLHYSPLNHL